MKERKERKKNENKNKVKDSSEKGIFKDDRTGRKRKRRKQKIGMYVHENQKNRKTGEQEKRM